MNRAAIAVLAAGVIITIAAADTLKQARNQLRSARLLGEQMEADHRELVKLYLQTRRKLRTYTSPQPPPQAGWQDDLNGEGDDE